MASAARGAPPRPAFYNDPRVRSAVYQVLTLALVLGAGTYLVLNTIENLNRLGVAAGFGFLWRPAGFGISQVPISYDETWSFGRAFLVGLINTAYVAVVGIVLATILGFVVGIARLSRNWLVSSLAGAYVEVIRNIPVLLQLIFVYKVVLRALPNPRDSIGVPGLVALNNRGLFVPLPVPGEGFTLFVVAVIAGIGLAWLVARRARLRRERTGRGFPAFWAGLGLVIGLPLVAFVALGLPLSFDTPQLGRFRTEGGFVLLPEFVAIVVGLSIYTSSYIAEIVRSGILAVSKGQTEAAMALGLPPGKVLRFVIIPQALRVIIPPLASQYLNLTKNSSLGVAIGYPEFFSIAGTVNNQTGQAVEVIAITMAVYLALSLLTSALMNWYNARIALQER